MKTKGLMTTFGILIVILSVVGVAYAAWMDTVKIEGKVYTGDFLVGWYKDCQYQLTWTETTNGVPEEQFGCPSTLRLPPDKVTLKLGKYEPGNLGTYFDLILSGVPNGYSVYDGTWPGWCVDEYVYIYPNKIYHPILRSSYDPNLPAYIADPDWDMVNYIINHKNASATWDDIQDAIWYFIDGGNYPSDPEAQAMVDDALANGEGYVPGCSDLIAVIADNGDKVQTIFFEVLCICDAKPWVANATVLLKEPERSKCSECGVTVYHSMRVKVYNAYPQWDLHITAWLKNAGTVPSKLCPNFKLHFADVTDCENLTYTLNTPYYDGDHWVYTGTVNDPVAGAIMNFVMYLYVPEDTQMEPCDVHKVEISVDFTQQLEECHKYDFSVEMTFIQWSKIAECPA